MKYDVTNYSDVDVLTTTEEKELTLSKDSTSLIFKMFSSNIYSNPIGTIVREITSNCFDSHIEANVNQPVIIKKIVDKLTNTIYISFIDFGVGMSPERINDVFSVLFNSTKRDDNQQIGAWGLGSKSPLAYKRSIGYGEGEYDNSYFIITKYNNFEYTYQIYEGKKCPHITLLNTDLTTDHNGTEVRVPILQKDLTNFHKEMVRQLYYFENIIFEGFEEENDAYERELTNDYQIIRGKSFLYRGTDYSEYVHVCLGKVAYPIDYNILNLNANDYKFPIAIRLVIGEIGTTISRESLDYSENTIKILKKKLEIVKNEIVQLLVKQYESIYSLEDYFKTKNKFGHVYFKNNKSFYIGNIIKPADISFVNFKYSFMKIPNDKQLFALFFDCKMYGKKKRDKWSTDKYFNNSYEDLINIDINKSVYYTNYNYKRKIIKQAWLKNQHSRYFIIFKKNIINKNSMADITELFNVHDFIVDDNGQPTTFTKTLINLQNEYFDIIQKNCTNYNDIEVPEDFVEKRKIKKLSPEILNTTIPIKISGRTRYSRVKLDILLKSKHTIFYGLKDDENKLYNARHMFDMLFDKNFVINSYNEFNDCFTRKNKDGGIMFIQLAANNIKYMKFCKKAYHVDNFYWKLLYRKVDVVHEYFSNCSIINEYIQLDKLYQCPAFSKVSNEWGDKIIKLNNFIKKINKKYNNHNWIEYKNEFSKYFDIVNIKTNPDNDKYFKILNELKELQEVNKDTFDYINFPYYINEAKDDFWKLLGNIMVY